MKKIILIMLASITIYSCSNDDANSPSESNSNTKIGEGSYIIDNNTKTTNYAYWFGGISSEATFTLTNVKLNSQDDVWNNNSDSVWFDLRPQPNETVNPGTYRFSINGAYDKYIQDGGHNADEFVSGIVTISLDKTIYFVNYDITLKSGKNIKGNYIGAINIVK